MGYDPKEVQNVVAAYEKTGNKAGVGRLLGMSHTRVLRILRSVDKAGPTEDRLNDAGGMTEKEILEKFDPVAAAKKAIDREIGKGFEGKYWPKEQWCARCGFIRYDVAFAQAARDPAYDAYKFYIAKMEFWTERALREAICKKMVRARPCISGRPS